MKSDWNDLIGANQWNSAYSILVHLLRCHSQYCHHTFSPWKCKSWSPHSGNDVPDNKSSTIHPRNPDNPRLHHKSALVFQHFSIQPHSQAWKCKPQVRQLQWRIFRNQFGLWCPPEWPRHNCPWIPGRNPCTGAPFCQGSKLAEEFGIEIHSPMCGIWSWQCPWNKAEHFMTVFNRVIDNDKVIVMTSCCSSRSCCWAHPFPISCF